MARTVGVLPSSSLLAVGVAKVLLEPSDHKRDDGEEPGPDHSKEQESHNLRY